MLNKISFTRTLLSIVAISAILFGGYELMAQPVDGQFINNTNGTYKAGNTANKKGGIIRMKGSASTSGEFVGTAALGATESSRIEGTVIWNKNGDQDVQPRYYTNLGVAEPLSASAGDHARNFGSGIADVQYFVSGDFKRYGNTLRATPLTDAEAMKLRGKTVLASVTVPTGVTLLPIISHTCHSDFWYDGKTDSQSVLGTILAANLGGENDNYYTVLNQWNSAALSLGSETYVQNLKQRSTSTYHSPTTSTIGPLQVASNAPLHIEIISGMSCVIGPNVIDTLEVFDCTNQAWADAHPIDCPTPCSGPGCDTADPCTVAALYTGPDVVIEITGGMSYDGVDVGKNIPFCFFAGDDCSDIVVAGSEPTRVIYRNTAVGIYPAHYGILEIGSDVDHDINLIGNVYIKGKRPYALDHNGSYNVVTGYGLEASGTPKTTGDSLRIVFEHICAQPDYAGTGEVEGWIYRNASDGRAYKYHNQGTTLQFDYTSQGTSSIPKDAASNEWFGLLSLPGVVVGTDALSKAKAPGTEYGYINRVWEVDFATANTAAAIKEMHLGHLVSEISTELAAKWTTMRGYEAWNSTLPPALLVGTSATPWGPQGTTPPTGGTIPTSANLFLMDQTQPIHLAGGTDPLLGESDDLYPKSQIVFGNVPTLVQTVKNGRWSNPATWGGMTPQKEDSVVIRHLIYTGIYDASTNSTNILGSPQWSRNEHDLPGVLDADGNVVLAKYVNILDETTILAHQTEYKNTTGKAGLIIGNLETAGAFPDGAKDPQGTAMNFDTPLVFGTIENNNTKGASWDPIATPLALTHLQNASIIDFGGVYVMGNQTTIPIVNAIIFLNAGSTVNEGIFDLGW
jgi:hypothetical protein